MAYPSTSANCLISLGDAKKVPPQLAAARIELPTNSAHHAVKLAPFDHQRRLSLGLPDYLRDGFDAPNQIKVSLSLILALIRHAVLHAKPHKHTEFQDFFSRWFW
jgi:hypothetical protein